MILKRKNTSTDISTWSKNSKFQNQYNRSEKSTTTLWHYNSAEPFQKSWRIWGPFRTHELDTIFLNKVWPCQTKIWIRSILVSDISFRISARHYMITINKSMNKFEILWALKICTEMALSSNRHINLLCFSTADKWTSMIPMSTIRM